MNEALVPVMIQITARGGEKLTVGPIGKADGIQLIAALRSVNNVQSVQEIGLSKVSYTKCLTDSLAWINSRDIKE